MEKQITLTDIQLQVLKEALAFYLDGFSEDDAPNEYREAGNLLGIISKELLLTNSISCSNCGGTGKFLELVDEIPTYVDCTRCEGTGEL